MPQGRVERVPDVHLTCPKLARIRVEAGSLAPQRNRIQTSVSTHTRQCIAWPCLRTLVAGAGVLCFGAHHLATTRRPVSSAYSSSAPEPIMSRPASMQTDANTDMVEGAAAQHGTETVEEPKLNDSIVVPVVIHELADEPARRFSFRRLAQFAGALNALCVRCRSTSQNTRLAGVLVYT